jgi:tetratricopeptide (TPR) repeat protein
VTAVDLDRLAELEEQRDFLLRSLDDLEAERATGDIDERDYRTLRDDYTARAAEVLRAIDEGQAVLTEARAARPRRPARVVAGAVVVVALAAGSGLLVARSSGDRLAGDTITGDIRQTSSQRLAEAFQLFQRGEALEAIKIFDEILAEDPDHREALAYRGWLLVLAGLHEEGERYIDRAIDVAPRYPDPRFFKAYVLRERGELDAALQQLSVFLDNDPPPDMVPAVRQLIDAIEAQKDEPDS